MPEENPEVNVTVELPVEDIERYIDESVQAAVEATQDTALTDIQLQELAQSSALIAYDMAVSSQEDSMSEPAQVQVVLTEEQWQKAKYEAQLVNSLLLAILLVTSALFGAVLVRYFVTGWRK